MGVIIPVCGREENGKTGTDRTRTLVSSTETDAGRPRPGVLNRDWGDFQPRDCAQLPPRSRLTPTLSFRLFGTTGYCAACNKVIPAFEMVMRARTNVYHLECFACQQCNHR